MSDRVREARARGEADARRVGAGGAVLGTPLGEFGAGGPGQALVRRALHALRVPPALVGLAARAFRSPRRRRAALALADRYAYWHGARAALDRETWRRLTQGPAILMYHAFGDGGEPGSRLIVPRRRFARQMAWLARSGRPLLRLDELAELRRRGRLPPAGSVVLTIDDGYADTARVAHPILRRHGFPATIFLVTARVGEANDWDAGTELAGRPLLGWEEIERLAREGIAVGAHSRTHPSLPRLARAALVEEVAGSRRDLAARVGEVAAFAYPHGHVSDAVVAAVEAAGFEIACGIERGLNGPATPLLRLRRTPIDGDASLLRFWLAVRFGDADVLARPLARIRRALLGKRRP